MAESLNDQILQIVARESTHQWAYLCHAKEEFTLCSQTFSRLLRDLTARSPEVPSSDLSPAQNVMLVQPAFPTGPQLIQLLVARQYQVLADHFSPEFDLRFYALDGDENGKLGTLLFIESRYQIQLSAEHAKRAQSAVRQIEALSPREAEVVTMVVSGMTNLSIAAALGLSPKTLEKHRKAMMTKLRVRAVAEVARIAFDAELFKLLQTNPMTTAKKSSQ